MKYELIRSLTLAAIALLILVGDPSVKIILFVIGVMAAASLISHWGRKLLFPYLDLKKVVINAVENNSLPAAIIFFSVCYIFSSIITATTSLLR